MILIKQQCLLETVTSADPSLAEIGLLRMRGDSGAIVEEHLAQREEIQEQQLINFIKSKESILIQNTALDIFPPKVGYLPPLNYQDLAKAYVRTQAAFVEKGVGYLQENNYLDAGLIKDMIEFNLDLKYETALKEAASQGGISLDLSKPSFLENDSVKNTLKAGSNSSSAELDKAFLKLSVGADFKEPAEKAFARDFVDVALMKSDTPQELTDQLTAFQVLVRNYHAYYRNDASLTPDSMKSIVRECDAALGRNLSPENTVKKIADELAFLKSIDELIQPDRDIVSNNFSKDFLILKNKLTANERQTDCRLIEEYEKDIARLIFSSPESLIHKQANCSDDRAIKINLFEAWCEKNSTITDPSKKISLEAYTENVSKALKIYQDEVIMVNYPNLDLKNNFVSQVEKALQSSGKAFAELATTNIETYPNELLRDGIPLRTFREYLLAALPDDCHDINNEALGFYRGQNRSEATKVKELREFVVDLYLSALQDSEKTSVENKTNLSAFLNSGCLEDLFVNPKLTTTEDGYQALSKQIIQETVGELRKFFTESLNQTKFQAVPLALSLRTLISDDALWSKTEAELISRTAEKIKPNHVKVYERLASELNRAEIPSVTGSIYRNIQKISMNAGSSDADKKSQLDFLLGQAFTDALVENRPLNVGEFFNNLELKLKEAENKIFNSDNGESLVLGDVSVAKKMENLLVTESLAAMKAKSLEDIILPTIESPDKQFMEALAGYETISPLVRQEYAKLLSGTTAQNDVSQETLGLLEKVIFELAGQNVTISEVLRHVLDEVSIYDKQLKIKEVKNQIIDTPIFKTLNLLLETKPENITGRAKIRADIFSDILASQMPENSLNVFFNFSSEFSTIVDFTKMTQYLLKERILAAEGSDEAKVKLNDFIKLCDLVGDDDKKLAVYQKYEGLVFSAEDLKHLTHLRSLLKLEQDALSNDEVKTMKQECLKYSYTKNAIDSSNAGLIDDQFLDNHLIQAVNDNLTPAGLVIDLDLFKQFRTDLLLLQLQILNSTKSGDSHESIKNITEKFIKANLINIFPEANVPADNSKNIQALGKFLKHFDQALSDDLHDKGFSLSSLNLEPSIKAALDTPANKIKNQMQVALENVFTSSNTATIQLPETITDINAPEIQFYLDTQKLITEMRLANPASAGTAKDISNAVFGKLAAYINQAANEAGLEDFNILALRYGEKQFVANLLNKLGVSNKALDTYFTDHKAEVFEASVQSVFQPSFNVSILTAVNDMTDVQALIDNAVINLLVAPDENALRAKAFSADAITRADELRIPAKKDIRQAYIEASRELINSRRDHSGDDVTITKGIVSEAGAFTQNIKDENTSGGLSQSEAEKLFYGQYKAFADLSEQATRLLGEKPEFAFLQDTFCPNHNTLSRIAQALQNKEPSGTEGFIQSYLLPDQGINSSPNAINASILSNKLNIGEKEAINSLALISFVLKGNRQTVAQELKEYLETKDSFLTDNVDGGRIPYINTASTHTKLQAGIALGEELSANSSVENGLVGNAVAEGIQAVIDSIKAANEKDPTVKLISNNYPSGALAGIITKSIFGEAQNLDASLYQLYKDSVYNPEALKQTEIILVELNKLAKAGADFKLCPDLQAKCAELNSSWEAPSPVNLKASQKLRLDFAIGEEVKLNNDDLTVVNAYVNLRRGFSTVAGGTDTEKTSRDLENLRLIEEFKNIYHQEHPEAEYNAQNPAYVRALETLNDKYSSIVEHHGTAPNGALVKNITDFIKESGALLSSVSTLAQAELIKIFTSAEEVKSQPATDAQKITQMADAYVKTYNQMQAFYRQNPAFFENFVNAAINGALKSSTVQQEAIRKANGLLGTFANIIQVLDEIFGDALVGSPKANFTPLSDTYAEIRQKQNVKFY
ncbi:MAG: hypothetical protein VKK32_05200 [Candidatus Melainabacteria bacterium]|nr:hypothetical protein [Candidatus Melainabacteria bacterium]